VADSNKDRSARAIVAGLISGLGALAFIAALVLRATQPLASWMRILGVGSALLLVLGYLIQTPKQHQPRSGASDRLRGAASGATALLLICALTAQAFVPESAPTAIVALVLAAGSFAGSAAIGRRMRKAAPGAQLKPAGILLALLVAAGFCAAAAAGAGWFVRHDPGYVWRYGTEVTATLPSECSTFYVVGRRGVSGGHTATCAGAGWTVDGQDRTGKLIAAQSELPDSARTRVPARAVDAVAVMQQAGTHSMSPRTVTVGQVPWPVLPVGLLLGILAWLLIGRVQTDGERERTGP
jgi:hypothetical protein